MPRDDRTLNTAEREALADPASHVTELLVSLRALAQFLDRGPGARHVALAITAAEEVNHRLQDAGWDIAGLDGPMRADRPWEGEWHDEDAGTVFRNDNVTKHGLCGTICHAGPNREPLACAYHRGHEGAHSWGSLPTWLPDRPTGFTKD